MRAGVTHEVLTCRSPPLQAVEKAEAALCLPHVGYPNIYTCYWHAFRFATPSFWAGAVSSLCMGRPPWLQCVLQLLGSHLPPPRCVRLCPAGGIACRRPTAFHSSDWSVQLLHRLRHSPKAARL